MPWRSAAHRAPRAARRTASPDRIAPAARVESPGYDNDAEAIGLAIGMEEKVHWSRVIRAGGPLGREHVGNALRVPHPARSQKQAIAFRQVDRGAQQLGQQQSTREHQHEPAEQRLRQPAGGVAVHQPAGL